MKKIVISLVLITTVILSLNAQGSPSGNSNYLQFSTFNNDTVTYLKANFETNKSYYIGKPVSVLLSDLELTVLSYTPAQDMNFKRSNGVMLCFMSYSEKHQKAIKHLKNLSFYIEFQTPVPNEEFGNYFLSLKANGVVNVYDWGTYPINFYKDRIIKDIKVIEYYK